MNMDKGKCGGGGDGQVIPNVNKTKVTCADLLKFDCD